MAVSLLKVAFNKPLCSLIPRRLKTQQYFHNSTCVCSCLSNISATIFYKNNAKQSMPIRNYSSKDIINNDDDDEPKEAGAYSSPLKMLKKEMKRTTKVTCDEDILPVPRESDIIIIGGGVMGLSVAYWLKQRHPTGYKVTVIEQDPQYSTCSSTRSVGGIRQQFSLPENIQMSLFSAEFLRDIKLHLNVQDLEPPDIHFNPQGYMFLSSEQGSETLINNYNTQINCGAQVELLDRGELSQRHSWLNTDGVALGSYGTQNEGWFDPWLLVAALKAKCIHLGTTFVKGELVDFRQLDTGALINVEGKVKRQHKLEHAMIKAEDGKIYPCKPAYIINCGGCWSKEVGLMAGIGSGKGALDQCIPVEKRKRLVFMFHCPDGPGLDLPILIDPSGFYVRREGLGGNYICGMSPTCDEEEPSVDTLDVTESDYNLFHQKIWPLLAHRIPMFENIKLQGAWAAYDDVNIMDENLIIGNHPYHRNFLMACGSSGHGLQHSISVGRAIMEFILDDGYKTIDLTQFGFDRVLFDEPVFEDKIR